MTAILFLAILLQTQPLPQFLDDAVRSGAISEDEKWEILVTAVTAPDHLPEYWQDVLRDHPIPPDMGTTIMHEAFLRGARFKDEYSFPEEMTFHIDSDRYPIRVEYDDPSKEALAQEVLQAAETAWHVEVEQWGWWKPPIVTPEGRYRFYVGDTGMGGGGYTAPIAYYPETDWTDCVTYIVIDQRNYHGYVRQVVAHEFNHATQAAMDCLEPSSFWENTATYIMGQVFPDVGRLPSYYLSEYQDKPYWGVDEGRNGSLYWYGGFIWPYFLVSEYAYEDEPGGIFMRKVWERSVQKGTMYNTIDYLHALDGMLKERGATLVDAFKLFTRARYFVGPNSRYTAWTVLPDSEALDLAPYVTGNMNEVPFTLEVDESEAPHEFGVNYIKITVTGRNTDRSYTFRITPKEHEDGVWYAAFAGYESGRLVEAEEEDGRSFTLTVPDRLEKGVLIIARYDWPNHAAGSSSPGIAYTVEAYPTVPLPDPWALAPYTIRAGKKYDAVLQGQYFQKGATIRFYPSGPEARDVTLGPDGYLHFTLVVPEDTLAGTYDVEVINPDAGTATLRDAVKVEKGAEDQDGGSDDGGCSTSRTLPPLWAALVVLMMVALGLRRRALSH